MFGRRDSWFWRNLLCVFAFLPSGVATATSVLAPSFELLVDRAELIFTGQVISQRSEWRSNDGQKSIVTLVTLAVQQVHKGHASSSVTLQFLGGTIGEVSLDVAEIPKFKPGERVVLFVEGNGINASPLVGFYHGKFSLQRSRAGLETVLRHNGEPFLASSRSGAKEAVSSAPAEEAVTHEEFVMQIRRRVAAGAK